MPDQDRISPYNTNTISKGKWWEEGKKSIFLGDYQLIQYQIIQSMRIVWPTVRRITNEILGCTNVVSNLIAIKKKKHLIWLDNH